MKTAAFALLLVGLVACADEKQTDKYPALDKWDGTYLEKQFGVKLKAIRYDEDSKKKTDQSASVTCVFEFVKDAEDVKAVRKAFTGVQNDPTIFIYLFDGENVVLSKTPFAHNKNEGDTEITGKKGDAFRVYTPIFRIYLDKAKKLEFRAVEPK